MSRKGFGLHASLHHPAARDWSEPHLHPSQLVYPIFVTDKVEDKNIPGFEPNVQWGTENGYDTLIAHLKELEAIGLRSVMLFGVVQAKDEKAEMAKHPETPVIAVTKILRKKCPDLQVMLDVCMCEYTDHGHCGWLRDVDGEDEKIIDNEASIDHISEVALSYAKAGAHWVCPSDMMDGRVATIRQKLDANGFNHVGIMAYTSKKASTMYAPFRAAVDSTFKGDRKRYQQPCGSSSHSMQALSRDVAEGASVVLVKPSLFYGDIIKIFSQRCDLPVAVYVVSGEYVMLRDYAMNRSGNLESVLKESHVGLLRAGASILITYFTPDLLRMYDERKL
mmetsp:Transcript_22318/g.27293  ORF Transcript_22318/g.27293 Transcript_22318/m.27293 type:complete len:335 (+) Transcript_22318:148-1152(+)